MPLAGYNSCLVRDRSTLVRLFQGKFRMVDGEELRDKLWDMDNVLGSSWPWG
jgi:hypothetical protein